MVVLPDADSSEDAAFDLEEVISSFLADPERLSLELPHMTTGQRRRARKLAEDSAELKCESYGFGAERQLHIFKKGFAECASKTRPAVNVKNTFIDDWIAPEDAHEPLIFRSMPLQGGRSPLQDAASDEAASGDNEATNGQEPSEAFARAGTNNGRELPRLPKELQPEVRNTFIHIEGDSVDQRMVQTMPRDMFRQQVNQEATITVEMETNQGFAIAEGTLGAGGLSTLPPPVGEQPTPAVPHLTPGTQIMVEGLVRAPAFNGLAGVVQFYEQEAGRYSVLLASGTGVQRAKIKGENLRLLAPPPYCAMGAKDELPPGPAPAVAMPLRLTALV